MNNVSASTRGRSKGDYMTHNEMVKRISRWMKNTVDYRFKCSIVVSELHTSVGETPDVIGFRGSYSQVVECKTSRSDYLADKKKTCHRFDNGMGDLYFYAIPEDDRFIKPEELTDKQGLLYVHPQFIKVVKIPATREHANKRAEVAFLSSVIRRLELSTAVYVLTEEPGAVENIIEDPQTPGPEPGEEA